jgi:hypothetical protein
MRKYTKSVVKTVTANTVLVTRQVVWIDLPRARGVSR